MLADSIQRQIAEAMKAKDELRLSTLRLLSSALNYEKIAKRHDLSEEEEIAVVRKEAKKRKDAIEALRQAQGKKTSSGNERLESKLQTEEEELNILKEFLPEELSDEELGKLVDAAIQESGAKEIKDMGKVIAKVLSEAKGKADGSKVAGIVKEKLS